MRLNTTQYLILQTKAALPVFASVLSWWPKLHLHVRPGLGQENTEEHRAQNPSTGFSLSREPIGIGIGDGDGDGNRGAKMLGSCECRATGDQKNLFHLLPALQLIGIFAFYAYIVCMHIYICFIPALSNFTRYLHLSYSALIFTLTQTQFEITLLTCFATYTMETQPAKNCGDIINCSGSLICLSDSLDCFYTFLKVFFIYLFIFEAWYLFPLPNPIFLCIIAPLTFATFQVAALFSQFSIFQPAATRFPITTSTIYSTLITWPQFQSQSSGSPPRAVPFLLSPCPRYLFTEEISKVLANDPELAPGIRKREWDTLQMAHSMGSDADANASHECQHIHNQWHWYRSIQHPASSIQYSISPMQCPVFQCI